MSYRKPESLIFTLLSLHRHCRDDVDKVWIGDDSSGGDALALLSDRRLAERLAPWRLEVFTTSRWSGWSETLVTGPMLRKLFRPSSGQGWCDRLRTIRGLLRRGLRPVDDIRYERALSGTTAEAVLVLHDDVEITGNIVQLYWQTLQSDPALAIVGQLGQCWRCGEADHCTPAAILSGSRPSPQWPVTAPPVQRRGLCQKDRACRINEWCCMIRSAAARDLAVDHIYFGNSEGGGDTGAYWFGAAVARGWGFADPFIDSWPHSYYLHGWQGHMGHEVWTAPPSGPALYQPGQIRARLSAEYGYPLSPRPQ